MFGFMKYAILPGILYHQTAQVKHLAYTRYESQPFLEAGIPGFRLRLFDCCCHWF